MWVRIKESADNDIITYKPPVQLLHRLKRITLRKLISWERANAGLLGEMYDCRSEFLLVPETVQYLSSFDIINLQYFYGFTDLGDILSGLPQSIPVVVSLHEMSLFTGGCSYAYSCDHYLRRCGNCPQLKNSKADDYSAKGWKLRKDAYSYRNRDNLVFVGNSNWTTSLARQSSLLDGFNVELIHLGLDIRLFSPVAREKAREVLKIPQFKRVVCFAAASVNDERKGMRYLVEAIQELPEKPFILSWGKQFPVALKEHQHLHLGSIDNERLLALAYSAGDLFVMPSVEESFGQTAIEACACGIPVVGFDVGGIPDSVIHNKTGLLVPPGDSNALAQAIKLLLSDSQFCAFLGSNGRAHALANFSLSKNAEAYVRLFNKLIQKS
jgi:glycosyltransferase involved in cell wall biosynthesis